MYRFYLALFTASALAFGVVILTTGHLLPKPFGTYNSHAHAALILEAAREGRTGDEPCIIVLGDSRAAFSINTAALSTPDCPARNYGYPALGLPHALQFAEEAGRSRRPRLAILTISDSMTFQPKSRPAVKLRHGNTFTDVRTIDYWLQFRPVLRAYLSFGRYSALGGVLRGSWPLDSGWTFSTELGRWRYNSLDNSVPLDDSPIRELIIDGITASYFKDRGAPPNIDALIDETLKELLRLADRVVIIISPQHPVLGENAERLARGEQDRLRAAIHGTAAKHGALVLDCLRVPACNLEPWHFIDPVHIGPVGAAAFSSFIAAALNAQLSKAAK